MNTIEEPQSVNSLRHHLFTQTRSESKPWCPSCDGQRQGHTRGLHTVLQKRYHSNSTTRGLMEKWQSHQLGKLQVSKSGNSSTAQKKISLCIFTNGIAASLPGPTLASPKDTQTRHSSTQAELNHARPQSWSSMGCLAYQLQSNS